MHNLVVLFALLFLTWMILSGVFTMFYLSLGVFSCLVAVAFYRLIYKDKINSLIGTMLRMVGYSLWLLKEISKSSLDISLRMWRLDPEIHPQAQWLPANLRDDVALTIYANSITLTPGSVTIGTKAGELYVHCLTKDAMAELETGKMLRLVQNATQSEVK